MQNKKNSPHDGGEFCRHSRTLAAGRRRMFTSDHNCRPSPLPSPEPNDTRKQHDPQRPYAHHIEEYGAEVLPPFSYRLREPMEKGRRPAGLHIGIQYLIEMEIDGAVSCRMPQPRNASRSLVHLFLDIVDLGLQGDDV